MICTNCGSLMEQGDKFCPRCGAAQPQPPQPAYQQQQPVYQQPQQAYQPYQQPVYQQPYQQPQPVYQQPYQAPGAYAPQNMTYGEFYNRFASKKTRNFVTWMAVICFVTAALSLVFAVTLENYLSILDIVVYVSMGILLLSTKQSIFATLPTIYGAIWTVVGLVGGGAPSGIVAIVVGVSCMGQLNKVKKAYDKYRMDGLAPMEEL